MDVTLIINNPFEQSIFNFKPIDKIIETANSINNGNDLSKRINLKKASVDVAKLGQTFDSMFHRLENSFEKVVEIIIEEMLYSSEKKNIKLLYDIEDNIFINGTKHLSPV